MIHNVCAPRLGIAAHVELDGVGQRMVVCAVHGRQAHFFADESLEFAGRDFTETFEAGDLRAFAAIFNG